MDFLFDAERYLCPGMFALVDLLGFIFALLYWQRCPKACVVAMLACLIDLLSGATETTWTMEMDHGGFDRMEWLGWVFVAMHWLAEALTLLAVFLGRDEWAARRGSRAGRPTEWQT